MPYWFNVQTREVVAHDDPERARSEHLLGPYETSQQAQDALETARRRTEEWDERERREAEWGSGDADRRGEGDIPLNG